MSQIHLLDAETQSRIAAGEVIDNPASILKELIENSLDAKATQITIELKNGGKTLLKIHDDGFGIAPEDLRLAVKRFATSKIKTITDLDSLYSLGFRGEALASIGAVASLKISSKTSTKPAHSIEIEGDIEKSFKQTETLIGTEIEITNLFFNIPARKKFLRSDQTETKNCTKIIEDLALQNIGVSFTLKNDNKEILNLPKVQHWIDRIDQIYPKDFSIGLIPISLSTPDLTISGFILKPEKMTARNFCQTTFVNNRLIVNQVLKKAILDGYNGLIVKGLNSAYIISIQINPELIDINVHPKKREIKFLYPSEVYKNLSKAIQNTLFPRQNYDRENPDPFSAKSNYYHPEYQINKINNFSSQDTDRASFNLAFETTSNPIIFKTKPRILGQIKNSYIICETSSEFWIVDQHALHERILYEKLKKGLVEKKLVKQKLTLPETLKLSTSEVSTFLENQTIFTDLGFEIEAFDDKSIILEAIPNIINIGRKSPIKIIHEIISDLSDIDNLNQKKKSFEIIDAKLKSIACRSAIMFGDKIEYPEMTKLLEEIEDLKIPYCPHGRPAIVQLTWDDLNKMFKRIL